MSFNQAIIDGHAQAAAKAARELAANLRKHGIPERRDLGGIQSLRARFTELPSSTFDRILREKS